MGRANAVALPLKAGPVGSLSAGERWRLRRWGSGPRQRPDLKSETKGYRIHTFLRWARRTAMCERSRGHGRRLCLAHPRAHPLAHPGAHPYGIHTSRNGVLEGENSPPPLVGGGWGEGLNAIFVRNHPSPPRPPARGGGELSTLPRCVNAVGSRQCRGTRPERAGSAHMKPSNSSFAQAIVCSIVFPVRIRATIPGMTARFHICTAISGGAEDPVM